MNIKNDIMDNSDKMLPTDKVSAVEAQNITPNKLSDFEHKETLFVPEDAEEKVAKEREYYDDKENPARNYNINDQAFSQSSPEDFVKTTSGFTHSDGSKASE